MRIYRQILIATCLSLSLAGCQAVAPTVINLGQPQGPQIQSKGSVNLSIRWPEIVRPGYNINAIPNSAQAIKLEVYQDDSQSVKLDEKVLKKSESTIKTLSDGSNALYSTTNLELNAGNGYSFKAYAYNSETTMDETTTVASGSCTPFSITSGRVTKVKLTLQVPNGPTLTQPTFAAAARGSLIKVAGTNLGVDATKIKAIYTMNNGGFFPCTVNGVNETGTEVTIQLPKDNYNTGDGTLKVYVDGIATNEIALAMVQDVEINPTNLMSRNENNVDVFYSLANTPIDLPVRGYTWNNNSKSYCNVPWTVEVVDSNSQTVSNALVDGKLVLPEGSYTVKVKAGEITKDYSWQSVTLSGFDTSAIEGTTVRVSKLGIDNANYPDYKNISLPGVLTNPSKTVQLTAYDFKWSYGGNLGCVTRDGDGESYWFWNNNSPGTTQFKATDLIGTTTVTATLKINPNLHFTFNLQNVGIKGFTFDKTSPSVRYGTPVDVKAQILLTDDALVNPTTLWGDWYSKFIWTSSNPSLLTVAPKAKPEYDPNTNQCNGIATLTAPGQATGSCTVTLRLDGKTAASVLNINVTDDGAVNLVIN